MVLTKVKNSSLILLILVVLCCIFAGFLHCRGADTAYASSSEDDRFVYHNSKINIIVDENKFLHIEENLTVAFIKKSDYFRRALPGKVNTYMNVNGKEIKGRSFLSRISGLSAEIDGVTAEVNSVERNGGCNYLTVTRSDGDFAKWVKYENEVYYKIKLSYVLDFSDDIDGKSSFYFNPFISYYNKWFYFNDDINDVSKLTVTVSLPAGFEEQDAALLKCGIKVDGGVKVNSSANSLTAVVPFNDIDYYALRVMFPENTFNTSVHYYSEYWWFVVAVALVMLFGIILVVIYRARRPLAPVEYEPPILNPMHFSAFWHGYARRRDVSTIILQWAQLGCIRIKKDGKKDLILTKIKNLPEGRTAAEYRYFKALFSGCDVYSSRGIRSSDFRLSYNNIRAAATNLVEEFGEPVTRAKGVETAKIIVMFSSLMTLVVSLAYFVFLAGDFGYASVLIFFIVPALAIVVSQTRKIVLTGRESKIINKNNIYKITSLIVSVCLFPAALVIYFVVSSHYMPVYDYIQITLISAIWIIICLYVLPRYIAKRTDEAQLMYGRMLGFKQFLTRAKVPEMEEMLEENPDYYLDVLPYCMIMGLSKKLDKKTEFLTAPEWADGFDAKHFASSLFYSVRHSIITSKKKVKK